MTEPRYLKLVTVSSFCPFTLISVLMPPGKKRTVKCNSISEAVLMLALVALYSKYYFYKFSLTIPGSMDVLLHNCYS